MLTNLQFLVKGQIRTVQIQSVNRCDLSLQSLSCEVFNHFVDHLILNGNLINRVRGETFKEATDLCSDDFRRIGNLRTIMLDGESISF